MNEIPSNAIPSKLKRNIFQRLFDHIRHITDPTHLVHFVYLVPSDTTGRAATAIRNAAIELQHWYRWQMVNGKTFTLAPTTPQVYFVPYPSSWFANNPNGDHSGWFWNNTLQVAAAYAGAGFYQPYDDWVIYVDAQPLPDQFAGGTSGGYISGCAVLGAKDLTALQGLDHDWTQCRAIGGSGHEYGHTHGLPHPPAGDPQWPQAIMGVGYTTYPNAVLRRSDRDTLNSNPFYTVREAQPRETSTPLCPFDETPTT